MVLLISRRPCGGVAQSIADDFGIQMGDIRREADSADQRPAHARGHLVGIDQRERRDDEDRSIGSGAHPFGEPFPRPLFEALFHLHPRDDVTVMVS